MITQFMINGVPVEAHFEEESVQNVLRPLVEMLLKKAESMNRRMIVLLAAPPAAGKSTLAAFLERLSGGRLQALGMDGFHRHQEEILRSTVVRGGQEIPMVRVKGAPESFDVQKLHRTLEQLRAGEALRFPIYDRRLHDVVEDAQEVTGRVLLIEGNWLLFNEGAWAEMIGLCDDSIYVSAAPEQLAERLIQRKMKGGLNRADAEAFYNRSDRRNIERLTEHHHEAQTTLVMIEDGVLNSLDIVSLITEINDRFDVMIPAEEIMPENFDSAEALWALISRLDED